MKGTLSTAGRAAAGRLEGVEPLELVRDLCRAQSTGVLRVRRGDTEKSLYLEGGRVVFAASTDPDDRLGVRLLHRRRVRVDQVDDAAARLGTGRRIGSLLVEDGSLSEDDLELGVREQTREIALSLFAWDRGDYRFEEGPLPTEEPIRLDDPIDALLLEGARRLGSFGRLRRLVGGPRARYRLREDADRDAAALTLREGEELTLRALGERERSAEELCRDLVLSSFEVLQALWAFRLLGWIEPAGQVGWSADGTVRGPEPGQDFATFFVDVCASGQTGVLEAARGGTTRTFHISEGRCLFAASDDEDDRLVHFLMRRGVITLRDGEEVNRRMLSNKRVGTILLELGAIDGRDLEEMVRQQVTEIVCDTFRRGATDLRFLPGPLPNQEEIALATETPALVTAGIRRVQSWRRLETGCGGLETPLALAPDYLDILDAMRAGEEEWEIVTALEKLRTPARLCLESRLGAFRVCQILWTLRLLGAVRTMTAEELAEAEAAAEVAAAAEAAAEAAAAKAAAEAERAEAERAEAERAETARAEAERAEAERAATAAAENEETFEAAAPEDTVEDTVEDEPVRAVATWEEEDRDLLRTAAAPETYGDPVDPADDDPTEIEGPGMTMRLDREQVERMLRRAADATDAADGTDAGTADGPIEAEQPEPPRAALPEPPADATQQLSREQVEAALRGERPAEAPDRAPAETDAERETSPDAAETQQLDRDELAGTSADDGAEADGPQGLAPDATQQLRREQVEEALGMPAAAEENEETCAPEIEGADADGEPEAADEPEATCDPAWVAPVDLEEAIAELNDRQRVVFRTVRMEIGAGAANFVRSNCAADEADGPVAGVELRADGSWDPDALRDAARAAGLAEPREVYRGLIEAQIVALEPLLGADRCARLRRHVEAVG